MTYPILKKGSLNKILSLLPLLFCIVFHSNNLSAQEEYDPNNPNREILTLEGKLPFHDRKQEFSIEIVNDLAIYQGDIILGPAKEFRPSSRRSAALRENVFFSLWPDGIIPYVIKENHPAKKLILTAIYKFNQDTPLTLKPYTNEQVYVEFIEGKGCYSKVGRTNHVIEGPTIKQEISIGPNCHQIGVILHEICHAAGLFHEQSRPDRDRFITIHKENIEAGKEDQFRKERFAKLLGTVYDKNSVMHYASNLFSNGNNKSTISCKAEPCEIGNRNDLSTGDIQALKRLYDPVEKAYWNENTTLYNLALGQPTQQSSDAHGRFSDKAVDGNTDGRWGSHSVTHTNFDRNPWWEVDLGDEFFLDHIIISNRADCCEEQLKVFDIMFGYYDYDQIIGNNPSIAWETLSITEEDFKDYKVLEVENKIIVPLADFKRNYRAAKVRISLPDNGKTRALSLAEVEVFGELTNVAKDRPTQQSSNAHGRTSENAVDGNTDGSWNGASVTHTNFETDPWWEVDLGDVYNISHIIIYNRTDCCNEWFDNFHIETLHNKLGFFSLLGRRAYGPLNWKGYNRNILGPKLSVSESSSEYEGDNSKGLLIKLDPNTQARYVRISIPGAGKAISLAEIKVLAIP